MQIQVDTHTHTLSSGHAYSTIIENSQAAAAKGLKMFCNTDHASLMPGAPHFWYFANQRVLPRFLNGVAVLRGVEANIINTAGNVDLDNTVLAKLDWVIASLHEPVFKPTHRDDHTEALINTIKSGVVDAIGHPGNPNYDFDFEKVIRTAAEYNVLVEINNSSLGRSRVGSAPRCEDIAMIAKEVGARITTGSDAHFAADVGNFSSIQTLLAHVDFPQELITTRHPQSLLDFLTERGKAVAEQYQGHKW
ncbi:phosphatase [Photobacterium phosphoreum]|uniref:phosphatase n=1 Tax=Photobacterium phosphoreum TaxID=659 RepID=UPI000D17A4D9|nr:phosphatase [Photobacterium phosphoreum]PSU72555.1 phosphatase [Photobacterium phosphoreum]PTB32980.1 phosphatase [Photobacterium phosphoreum]